MKKLLFLLLSATTLASNFEGSIGGGFQVISPLYESRENKVIPIPMINLELQPFYLRSTNIGLNLYTERNFTFSVFFNPIDGYLSGFAIEGNDMKNGYRSIEDRKTGIIGGLQLSFLSFNEISTNISYAFGQRGDKFNMTFGRSISINDRFIVTPSIYGNYYLEKYTDYYFGINQKEASLNENISKTYSPDASYSLGASLTGEYFVTEPLSIIGFIGCDYFGKEISDSPIVRKNNSIYYGFGLRYSF